MQVPGLGERGAARRRRLVRPSARRGLLQEFRGDRRVPLEEDSSAAVLETVTRQSKSQDGLVSRTREGAGLSPQCRPLLTRGRRLPPLTAQRAWVCAAVRTGSFE